MILPDLEKLLSVAKLPDTMRLEAEGKLFARADGSYFFILTAKEEDPTTHKLRFHTVNVTAHEIQASDAKHFMKLLEAKVAEFSRELKTGMALGTTKPVLESDNPGENPEGD